MALNAKLSAEIRALRAEIREPIQSEPDDISAYDFTSVRPTPTPPTDDPPPVPGTVDDAEAPATVPPPDDIDDPFVSPFTGVPGTGFDGTAAPAPKPAFNQRIYAYIESLPRGEQKKATNALRQYVYGPGNMQPDDALQRYKERRVRDAQAPVGSTEFDDLAASDSDAEESDDDILGAGATMSKPALPEALSRDDSDADYDNINERYATHERYARGGLVARSKDLLFDVQHGLESNPDEDPDGDARLAAWQQRYGYPISAAPGFVDGPNIHRDHVDAFDRENDEYRKAHWRQRNKARWEMKEMRRERQATQADAQQNIGVHLARSYAPGAFDMITRHPRHGTNAVDPFAGSEVQRMLEGSGDNCSDTILVGAGLTVY